MNTETLASAIVGHLVGDYLLQNDWMAQNKRKNVFPLAVHCVIWTACVMNFSGWSPNTVAYLVLVLTHMAQDGTGFIKFWMTRINCQPVFALPPLAPWSIIVVDNVWHILTIWIVWRFIV